MTKIKEIPFVRPLGNVLRLESKIHQPILSEILGFMNYTNTLSYTFLKKSRKKLVRISAASRGCRL